MKNNIENGIYIPDEHRNLIPVDEWVKREDPTAAQAVVLVTDFGMLEIAKGDLPGGFNFEGAQKAAAEYRKGFRCPTRHEAIEMYDPDPEYNSNIAFRYNGNTGYVSYGNKYNAYAVRPVSAFKE